MSDERPIIIKKIKKVAGGHHGGAWKVAYADFVTAMMAFFLLLWLLSSTSPQQKSGIAEHFTPTIGLKDSKGIGFQGGLKSNAKGQSKEDLTAPGLVVGQVQQGSVASKPSDVMSAPEEDATEAAKKIIGSQTSKVDDAKGEGEADVQSFRETTDKIKQVIQENKELEEYKNNIVVQETPEGLKIDLIDDRKKPMFLPGRAIMTDMGKKVLDSMVNIVIKTPNNITIHGHTDANSTVVNPLYTNWELSADRANSARRFLSSTQMQQDRVVKVVGNADRDLLVKDEPQSPRNRRITILLMRGSYFRDPKIAPTTRNIITVPEAKIKPNSAPKPQQPAPEPERNDPASQLPSLRR